MTDLLNKKETIALQKWWLGELQKITQKTMNEEDRRQERAKAKNEDKLADYNSRDEIRDAYGYGFITEKQMDKLLDMWDERENGAQPDSLYQRKITLLSEFYQLAKQVIQDAERMESF